MFEEKPSIGERMYWHLMEAKTAIEGEFDEVKKKQKKRKKFLK